MLGCCSGWPSLERAEGMKHITTLAEAKCVTIRIIKLEVLMDKAQANEANWKRTLGCPGSRYLPEWEECMAVVVQWMKLYASMEDVEALADYEESLRK